MNYDQIIGNLSQVINSDFNMQSLMEIKKIYVFLSRVYRHEILKANSNRNLCAVEYERYLNYVNDVVFTKLKGELGLEDKLIKRIFSYIMLIDEIEDIYALDGNIIVKYNDTNKNNPRYSFPELNLIDISTKRFIQDSEKNMYISFVALSINNAVKSMVDNHFEPEDVLEIKDGKINYLAKDLHIYASRDMSDILMDKTGEQITKILVIYEDELFYFDLKIRDEYVILNRCDYKENSISEMFKQKEKQKCLK